MAGVNAQKQRPVYATWRGTMNDRTHAGANKAGPAQSMAPGLQQQIDYIHQKASAEVKSSQTNSPATAWLNALPAPPTQPSNYDHYENTLANQRIDINSGHHEYNPANQRIDINTDYEKYPPTNHYIDPTNGYYEHALTNLHNHPKNDYHNLIIANNHIEALGKVIHNMSVALNTCQALSNSAYHALHTEVKVLLTINRKLHGNRVRVEQYINDYAGSLSKLVGVLHQQASAEEVAMQAKKMAKEGLGKLGMKKVMAEEGEMMALEKKGNLMLLDKSGNLVPKSEVVE